MGPAQCHFLWIFFFPLHTTRILVLLLLLGAALASNHTATKERTHLIKTAPEVVLILACVVLLCASLVAGVMLLVMVHRLHGLAMSLMMWIIVFAMLQLTGVTYLFVSQQQFFVTRSDDARVMAPLLVLNIALQLAVVWSSTHFLSIHLRIRQAVLVIVTLGLSEQAVAALAHGPVQWPAYIAGLVPQLFVAPLLAFNSRRDVPVMRWYGGLGQSDEIGMQIVQHVLSMCVLVFCAARKHGPTELFVDMPNDEPVHGA